MDIDGILLLTAPNMSGKSTVMRATLVAALLANCGLCIPASSGSLVPRYDCFFIRTSSYDMPSEGMSAFGLEMDDMRVILRDSTPASLVMIDEIGKGTSSRDGAAIAGALLEYLDQRQVNGIFATHLHELLALPLHTKRLHRRRMGIKYLPESSQSSHHLSLKTPQWTYCLEDGVCTDSMAIVTARAFGLPDSLLERATTLGAIFDDQVPCVEGKETLCVNLNGDDPPNASIIAPKEGETIKGLLQGVMEAHIAQSVASLPSSDGLGLYDIVYIPHDSVAPAYLEGQSCLYVLDIEMATENMNEQIVYVGESEAIAQRLQTHKR